MPSGSSQPKPPSRCWKLYYTQETTMNKPICFYSCLHVFIGRNKRGPIWYIYHLKRMLSLSIPRKRSKDERERADVSPPSTPSQLQSTCRPPPITPLPKSTKQVVVYWRGSHHDAFRPPAMELHLDTVPGLPTKRDLVRVFAGTYRAWFTAVSGSLRAGLGEVCGDFCWW